MKLCVKVNVGSLWQIFLAECYFTILSIRFCVIVVLLKSVKVKSLCILIWIDSMGFPAIVIGYLQQRGEEAKENNGEF